MVNSRYSSEVVDRVLKQNRPALADYRDHPGAIPAAGHLHHRPGPTPGPAERVGRPGSPVQRFPFRTRTDGGPRDDFEREALQQLRSSPDHPYYRFEEFQTSPVLRYAIARRMETVCLGCHNYHPDSQKKDWKVGDVRGVLEIIRPLDHDIERTRKGLRGTFLLVGAVPACCWGGHRGGGDRAATASAV